MRSKNATFSLIVILILVGFAIMRMRLFEPHRKEAFDRHPHRLEYTRHVLCKMDCRHISKKDIDEVMAKGVIIFNKSNMHDRPCPTFALQGYTSDHENLRVIFAQCVRTTKVVTCYNLDDERDCNCLGVSSSESGVRSSESGVRSSESTAHQ